MLAGLRSVWEEEGDVVPIGIIQMLDLALTQPGLRAQAISGPELVGEALSMPTLSPGGIVDFTSLFPGLISFWKFAEGAGQSRLDSFGGNHLTQNGTVVPVTGKIGVAADIAAGSALQVSHHPSLSPGAQPFTVAGWVFWPSLPTPATPSEVLAKSELAAGQTEYRVVYSSALDRLIFEVRNPGGTISQAIANAFGAVPSGSWLFIAAGWDAAAGSIFISINRGARDMTAFAGPVATTTAALRFGRRGSSGPNEVRKYVDAWGLWIGRALTAADALLLYNSGLGTERFDSYIADPMTLPRMTAGTMALPDLGDEDVVN